MIDENLKLTGELVGELRQHIANATWKYVDAAHMQHIIAAAQHPKAQGGPPARTGASSQDTHHVTGAIAYQGLSLFHEMRVDQLTLRPVDKRERRSFLRFNQLDRDNPACLEVQPLALLAFRTHDA